MKRALVIFPFVANAAAAQQQVPTRTLAQPDAEYTEPFSMVTSIRELRDGRVLVADGREKTLQAVNIAGKKATPVGREGSGPQEWAAPGRFLPFSGDSTLMTDGRNGRFLVIDPDGKAARSFSPAADAATTGTSGVSSSGGGVTVTRSAGGAPNVGPQQVLQARAVDARGRFYFTGIGFTFNANGGMSAPDTLPLTRSDIAAKQIDTLAWIRQVAVMQTPTTSGGGVVFGRVVPPFKSGDEWVVFADGRIAIARSDEYRVDIITPDGKRTAGSPVAFTPVRVTDADKEQWRRERRGTGAAVSFGGGGGAPSTTQNVTVPEPASWPETKSPFQTGAAFAAPNGETWVFRSRAATDPSPVADVFNAQGRLTGRVALPARTKLVGFGAASVYLVRSDDDDLQYLQRYAIAW